MALGPCWWMNCKERRKKEKKEKREEKKRKKREKEGEKRFIKSNLILSSITCFINIICTPEVRSMCAEQVPRSRLYLENTKSVLHRIIYTLYVVQYVV